MIDTLIFSGGGVRCGAYLGAALAMKEMAASGIPIRCKRLAGTSGGALFAMLLAIHAQRDSLGCLDMTDMTRDFESATLKNFQDDSFGVIQDVARFIRSYGWFKGDRLEDWCVECLTKHGFPGLIGFGEFRDMTGVNLKVTGTELSARHTRVFCADDTPDFPVARALRISTSYPFIFAAPKEGSTECYTDGGVLMNYPITLFSGHLDTTVGFMVKGCSETVEPVNGIISFTKSLVSVMLDSANEKHMSEEAWKRTIVIETDISSMRNITLKENTRLKMVGYKTTILHSEKFNRGANTC